MKTLAERTTTPARTASASWHHRPRVSAPTDASELDADRMADEALRDRLQVVPTSAGSTVGGVVQRQANDDAEPSTGGPPAPYPDERDDDWDDVAASSRSVRAGVAPIGFASAVSASAAGAPMHRPLQGRMETAFGRSFDAVRVHADAGAGKLADSINARAFTRGNDVYFGPGEYAPGTEAGDRLLAHELGHTIQQSGGEIRRQKKGDRKRSKSPYDPSRMTDEEKIRLRTEFRQSAQTATEQMRDTFKASGPVNAAKRADYIRTDDEAIESARKITDQAQRDIRLAYLQAHRQLLNDDFYAWATTEGHIGYRNGHATTKRLGDPTSPISQEWLDLLVSHIAFMKGGVDSYVTMLNEVGLYEAYGVDPAALQTSEAAKEEAGQPGAGTAPDAPQKTGPQGAIGGKTLEERKVIEELHAALGDLLSEATPAGDQELLIHELEKLTEEQRKDFYDFVRGQIESQPAESEEQKTLNDLIDMFNQLDPAAREALRVNREMQEADPRGEKPLPKDVLLDLQKEAKASGDAADDARRIQTNLDLIRNATVDEATKKELQGLDFGVAVFFEEMAMLQGLLAGAGRESELVRDVGQELIKEIVAFRQKLQRELLELAAESLILAGLTAATEGLAGPIVAARIAALAKRIRTIKKLIETLQRIYSIYDRIQRVITIVQSAGDAYVKFRAWYDNATTAYAKLEAQLESLESGEDLEEALEAQEERLIEELDKQMEGKFGEILEMMYIPEDTPPEELRKILFNIPRGVTALEHMWDFYRRGKRDDHFAEVLAIRAFSAGRLLYPLVGLTAALVAEQLQAAFPERTIEDRINRLISKSKRGPGARQRNRSPVRAVAAGRTTSTTTRSCSRIWTRPSRSCAPRLTTTSPERVPPSIGPQPGSRPPSAAKSARSTSQFKSVKVTATRKEKKPGGGTTEGQGGGSAAAIPCPGQAAAVWDQAARGGRQDQSRKEARCRPPDQRRLRRGRRIRRNPGEAQGSDPEVAARHRLRNDQRQQRQRAHPPARRRSCDSESLIPAHRRPTAGSRRRSTRRHGGSSLAGSSMTRASSPRATTSITTRAKTSSA